MRGYKLKAGHDFGETRNLEPRHGFAPHPCNHWRNAVPVPKIHTTYRARLLSPSCDAPIRSTTRFGPNVI